MDEVAVGAVDLDTVEAGLDRTAGGVDVLGDDGRDLVLGQLARHRVRLHPVGGEHLAGGGQRARGDGLEAVLVVRVGDPAGVHELDDDPAALAVHGVGDLAPALDLRVAVDAGRGQVALADGARLRALGDDEGGRGALAVVLDLEVGGDAVRVRAVAGQRRQHDAVRQLAEGGGQGGEQVGHGVSCLSGVGARAARHVGGPSRHPVEGSTTVGPGHSPAPGRCRSLGRAGRLRGRR